MVVCLERGADLHMAQLMPLPLTVSCISKIQIGFTFLVPAHPGSPGQRAVKRVCVCVCVCDSKYVIIFDPLFRGYLIGACAVAANVLSMVTVGDFVTNNSRMDRPRIFKLGGVVPCDLLCDHCPRSKGQGRKLSKTT